MSSTAKSESTRHGALVDHFDIAEAVEALCAQHYDPPRLRRGIATEQLLNSDPTQLTDIDLSSRLFGLQFTSAVAERWFLQFNSNDRRPTVLWLTLGIIVLALATVNYYIVMESMGPVFILQCVTIGVLCAVFAFYLIYVLWLPTTPYDRALADEIALFPC